MGKKLEGIKEKVGDLVLDILDNYGETSINKCCILISYEPEIPSELEESML